MEGKTILESSLLGKEKMVGDKFPKGRIVPLCCDVFFFSPFKTSKYYIKDATDVQLFFFFSSTFSVPFFPSHFRLLHG